MQPNVADSTSNSRTQATAGSVVLMSFVDGQVLLHAFGEVAVPTCAGGSEVVV